MALKMVSHCPQQALFPGRNGVFVPGYATWFFLSVALKEFPLITDFEQVDDAVLCWRLFPPLPMYFLCLGSLGFGNLWIQFSLSLEIFQPLFLQILLLPSPPFRGLQSRVYEPLEAVSYLAHWCSVHFFKVLFSVSFWVAFIDRS